ncbi:hypothetical protein D3C75_557840 [compost metagenome]
MQALALHAQIFRLDPIFGDLVVFQLGNKSRRGETELVQTIFRMHYQHMFAAQTLQDLGQWPAQRRSEHAHYLMFHTGRIRKRAEHVEQRTQAKIAARTGGVLHGLVVGLGKHETDANVVDAARHLHRGQVQIDTGGFQQIGTAALARYRTVAVLGHGATGRRDDKGRSRGHVEDVRTVTAGADHIDHTVEGLEFDLVRQFAHHRHGTDDFVDAFALHAHGHHERANLRIRALPGHDLAHDIAHFIGAEVEVIDDTAQGCLDVHEKSLARAAGLFEEVGEQFVALFGEDRLRVELHAFDVQSLVTQAHDLVDRAVFELGPGRQLQAIGQGFALDDQ